MVQLVNFFKYKIKYFLDILKTRKDKHQIEILIKWQMYL